MSELVRIPASTAKGYKLVAADDPRAAQPITRDAIAKMKRGEVLDHLEAHGVSGPMGMKLADLRKTLTEIMFVGL